MSEDIACMLNSFVLGIAIADALRTTRWNLIPAVIAPNFYLGFRLYDLVDSYVLRGVEVEEDDNSIKEDRDKEEEDDDEDTENGHDKTKEDYVKSSEEEEDVVDLKKDQTH
jgi:hypothetical protein